MKQRGVVASVLPLFAGLGLLMVGNGLLGSLLGIQADAEGFPTVVIGVVMAMYYVGFLLGSLTVPRWLVAVGHIRVFSGLAALASATALSYSLIASPWTWGALRFVAGLCMSGLYVTVESWLNDRSSNETRGRLLSVYMLVVTLGLAFGQTLLGLADPSESTLFILAGILISLAVVPIALIRIPTPSRAVPVEFSVRALFRAAPFGVVAVAFAGAAGSSILALGALYATNVGMRPSLVGVFMATSLVGAVVTQYPIGYLSDAFPRRRVTVLVAAGAVAAAAAAVATDQGSPWLFVFMGIYGGLAFPMYSLAVSQINDVIPEQQLVAAAAGIVFVYGIGSVVGPLTVSWLMAAFGPTGYLWGLAGFFLPVALYGLARVMFMARPIQRRFISLPARSSTAAALLAEPSDDDQQDS